MSTIFGRMLQVLSTPDRDCPNLSQEYIQEAYSAQLCPPLELCPQMETNNEPELRTDAVGRQGRRVPSRSRGPRNGTAGKPTEGSRIHGKLQTCTTGRDWT